MAEYGFIAARAARVDHLFVSTDSAEIADIGDRYGAQLIERPSALATPEALTEDVLVHAGQEIGKRLGCQPDLMVLLLRLLLHLLLHQLLQTRHPRLQTSRVTFRVRCRSLGGDFIRLGSASSA